ncbi:ribose 5-phosphate isomerase A [Halalkalibacter wakoensis JCM 9140]|uniref:Ribose-5-phosphate isomerase A n=1 Tax=Halalkalibacter wakoensis JCM 9140 TaxID=1236970 RepID=W4Q7F0_9BACI|nr:ribose-5-phosphate isomerase RpiA [Halalkalibacter wakoensis]GAE27309.1 ribose 5-phosphate isomerase A [Halalkalibacter wakoensis JCM 9140]
MTDQVELRKKRAGEKAVELIEDGMTIGLGSGSTVYWTIKKIGELVNKGMKIKGVPSSIRTEGWANQFGVPLTDFSQVTELDLAIDGADEVDPSFNLIKGGGGSLVREKIVNAASKKLIIVVDESKVVNNLGEFGVPIEVVPFGWEVTAQRMLQMGCHSIQLRKRENEIYLSNNGNYILDCYFGLIEDAMNLHSQLKQIVGVVETGLFIGMTDHVIVGKDNGVQVLRKNE